MVLRWVTPTNAAGVLRVGSMLMAERLCTRTNTVMRWPGSSRNGTTETVAGISRRASGSRLPASRMPDGCRCPGANR